MGIDLQLRESTKTSQKRNKALDHWVGKIETGQKKKLKQRAGEQRG